jgi:hypothetical protein
MASMPKSAKYALLAVAVLAFVAIVTRWWIFASYNSLLQREIAFLRAEGGSTDMLDLVLKPLGRGPGAPVALLKADDFQRPYPDPVKAADPNDPVYAEAREIVQADVAFLNRLTAARQGKDRSSARPVWDDSWNTPLERLTAGNSDFLAFLRKTTSGPPAMFDTDWSKGYNTLLPQLSKIRACTRLLAADAMVNARRGDMDAAMADVVASFRLRRLIDNDPMLVSKLVATALDTVSFDALEGIMRTGRPSRASVKGLLDDLSDREDRNRMTLPLLGETASVVSVFNDARKDPRMIGTLNSSSPSPYADSNGVIGFFAKTGARIVWVWPADEYYYLQETRALRTRSRLPFPDALKAAPGPSPSANAPMAFSVVTRTLVPALGRMLISQARSDAQARMARIALALYLCRSDNGSYPPTLDALSPDYLPSPQLDPFDGKPLRYKPSESGFLIYSVGEDQGDDGGVSPSDIVWEHEE